MDVNSCAIARRWLPCQAILFLAFAAVLAGCAGPTLSSVSGTVTYKGDKVKGGTLIFSPAGEGANPGPPSSATVQEDGTFAVKTIEGSGGAVVGKCTVGYTAPGGEASTDPKKQGTPSPYAGLVPKETSLEVKPGANTFNIELVQGK
jgi:hypothetical protein